jgi:cation:H+ antiporter
MAFALPWDGMWTLIGLGLFFLALGGDFLVKASVDIAARLGVSPLLIGLTLVGFGTSTPELVTSLQAALVHSPGIAIGNVVGSNIANVLLILGLSAILMPVAASAGAIYRDGLFVVVTATLLAWVSLKGNFTSEMGMVFIGLLAVYVATAWAFERSNPESERTIHLHEVSGLWQSVLVAIGSIGILILGASFLVDGSVQLARRFELPETFIGLTLVAVGTSLPELFTSVTAALRRQSDIAIGNILGSNIYNILGIGGIVAVVHPVEVPAQIATFDNFVMIGVSVLLLAWLVLARGLGRLGGIVFLALYAGYIFLIHPSNKDGMASIAGLFTPLADVLRAINF